MLKILSIILLFFINCSAWKPTHINTNCPADPTFNDKSSCYGAQGINTARCVHRRQHLRNIYINHEYAESLSLDGDLNKGAVKALRETLAKASRHGINIEKSVDHFY